MIPQIMFLVCLSLYSYILPSFLSCKLFFSSLQKNHKNIFMRNIFGNITKIVCKKQKNIFISNVFFFFLNYKKLFANITNIFL